MPILSQWKAGSGLKSKKRQWRNHPCSGLRHACPDGVSISENKCGYWCTYHFIKAAASA